MAAYSPAERRVPPMLDISFTELARGAKEELLADQGWCSVHQRHHILKLVAETESAT